MHNEKIPYQIVDWERITVQQNYGLVGKSLTKQIDLPGLRIRKVNYSKGYIADHWCKRGHLVFCLSGEFTSELEDGTKSTLRAGMSYFVSDNVSTHRSYTETGVELLIIDGEFLR